MTPDARRRLAGALMTEQFNRPTPQDTEVVERGGLLPVGTYANGMTGPALPGFITQPFESFKRLVDNGYEPGNPQSAEDAFNVAGAAMVGGLAAPKPSNTVGIFGGRLAKTADHAKLAQAERMAAEGAPREQIWNQTGWFQGPDKKWRFEIDDSRSTLPYSASGKEYQGPVGALINHPDLMKAYPEIGAGNGSLTIADHISEPKGAAYKGGGIVASAANAGDARRVLLHELQHQAQSRDGFALGGSPGANAAPMNSSEAWSARMPYVIRQMMDERGLTTTAQRIDAWPKIKEELRQRISDDTGRPARFGRTIDGIDDADRAAEIARASTPAELKQIATNALRQTGMGVYERLAGEVEARAVEKRMNLTPEQRAASPPWLDYDVPENQQIVRFGNTGPSKSIGMSGRPEGALNANGGRPGAAVGAVSTADIVRALMQDDANKYRGAI